MDQCTQTGSASRRGRLFVRIACVCLLFTFGCTAPSYRSLVSEDQSSLHAPLKAEAALRPVTMSLAPTCIDGGPVVELALYETGNPHAQRTLVFLHGAFSDHQCWRFITGTLGREHRLLLIDLPGSGASDKPDPETLEPDGYAPDALAERVLQALDQHFEEHTDDGPITIIGHSLGGTLALRMMGDDTLQRAHRLTLSRVDRLALLAPADIQFTYPSEVFQTIAQSSDAIITIGAWMGILKEKIAAGTLNGFASPEKALREEADRRYAILRDPASRQALRAIFQQTVPTRDGRPDWPAIERYVSDYGNVRIPCLLIWGVRDETLPVAMGFKLAAQLPDARLQVIEHCMHSAHIECPNQCAQMIQDFNPPLSAARDVPVHPYPAAKAGP